MADGSPLEGLLRGLRRRCPACGRGRMYDGFYVLRESCAECGCVFESAPGEFTGALMAAQGAFGLLAVVGTLALYVRGAGWVWIYAWLAVCAVLLPLLLYPNIKGAWLGFLEGARRRDAA